MKKKVVMYCMLLILLILAYTAYILNTLRIYSIPSWSYDTLFRFVGFFIVSMILFPFKRKVSTLIFYTCFIVLLLYSALVILEHLLGFSKWLALYLSGFFILLLIVFVSIEIIAEKTIGRKKSKLNLNQ
jgi:hypothetical protein